MGSTNPVQVRLGSPADREQLARLRHALWPEACAADHAKELKLILAGKSPGILPATVFVAESDGGAILGFLEAGLRSHASLGFTVAERSILYRKTL